MKDLQGGMRQSSKWCTRWSISGALSSTLKSNVSYKMKPYNKSSWDICKIRFTLISNPLYMQKGVNYSICMVNNLTRWPYERVNVFCVDRLFYTYMPVTIRHVILYVSKRTQFYACKSDVVTCTSLFTMRNRCKMRDLNIISRHRLTDIEVTWTNPRVYDQNRDVFQVHGSRWIRIREVGSDHCKRLILSFPLIGGEYKSTIWLPSEE